MRRLRVTVPVWGIAGLCAGSVVSVLFVHVNQSIDRPGEIGATLAWVSLVYALGVLALGLLSLAASGLLVRVSGAEAAPPAPRGEMLALLGFFGVLGAGYLATSAIGVDGLRAGLRAGVLLGAFAVGGWLRVRPPAVLAVPASLAMGLGLVVGCASLGYAGLLALEARGGAAVAAEPVAGDPDARVFLIGVDGADWDRIDALVAAGKLPTFEALMRRGVRAPLRSMQPTWSPIIWNTIATGQTESGHGVHDFSETMIPGFACGLQRLRKDPEVPQHVGLVQLVDLLFDRHVLHEIPVTSCHRKAKAVWNILSDRGRRVAALNWFASWPSEDVNGYVVSDNNPHRAAFLTSRHGAVGEGTFGVTSPASLLDELGDLEVPEVGDSPEAVLALDFFDGIDRSDPAYMAEPGLLLVFRMIYQSDAFTTAIADHLLSREHLDFIAMYISGADNVSHRFGHWPGVVDRYYVFVDSLLARVVAHADENTHVVIVSDHGWEYDDPVLFGHAHAPDGIILMAGPRLREGVTLETKPSVFDVAPMVLSLFDFPKPDTAPGHFVASAYRPDRRPGAGESVADYGTYTPPDFADFDAGSGADELQQETIDKLRALGYVQ